MRNLLTVLAILALSASIATAAPTVGIYFDGGMNETSGTFEPMVETDLYIVISGIEGGAAGIQYELQLPWEVVVLSHDYNGGLSLNPNDESYEIGFASCQVLSPDATTSYVVDHFTVTSFIEFGPAPMSLGPCVDCNDSSTATAPRYASCNSALIDLQVESGTIAAATVPTKSESWGAVKALFAN